MRKVSTNISKTLGEVFLSLFSEILYFPAWWYSKGLIYSLKNFSGRVASMKNRLAIDIWLKNFFVPMYGQYDIAGRLISVFIRFCQIIFRSIVLAGASIIYFFVLVFYFTLPLIVIFFILLNLKVFKISL